MVCQQPMAFYFSYWRHQIIPVAYLLCASSNIVRPCCGFALHIVTMQLALKNSKSVARKIYTNPKVVSVHLRRPWNLHVKICEERKYLGPLVFSMSLLWPGFMPVASRMVSTWAVHMDMRAASRPSPPAGQKGRTLKVL